MTITVTMSSDVTDVWQCDIDVTLTLTLDPNKENERKKEKEKELNTGLQDLSSISPSSMTHLQANVPKEAVVLYQSNMSIEETNLISQDNSNKLSLLSKIVLFLFFSRYNLTSIF